MKPILLPLLTAVAVAVLSAGCATHEGAYEPKNTTESNLENSAKFVLEDPGAQRSVTSSGLQETVLADGRLQVVVNLRNRENRRIQVQVNCEFKDEQGFPIDSTPFQNIILTENAQEAVKFISLNNQAKKYTVRVRQAR